MGQLEICITPSNGRSISKIKNIAPPMASEQIRNADRMVLLRGAFMPKLAKMTMTYDTRITSTTRCTLGPCCSISSQR